MTFRSPAGVNAAPHTQVRLERPNTPGPTPTSTNEPPGPQQVQPSASGTDAAGFTGHAPSSRGNAERLIGLPSGAPAPGATGASANRTSAVHQRIQLLMGSMTTDAGSAAVPVVPDHAVEGPVGASSAARHTQKPMNLEEALAARARAPSKQAFFATGPTFDSLATFARVTLEGHELGADFAGRTPADRQMLVDKPWAPDPTDLFIRNSYSLLPAPFQENVTLYHRREPDRERHETLSRLEQNGPWAPILQAWPELLATSQSKFLDINGNYIFRQTLYQTSAVGLLGAANLPLDFDTLYRHAREELFGKLAPDGSIQVQAGPGPHFIADALARNEPKMIVYRGETLFSARRLDFLRELAAGAPSAKTLKNVDKALEQLERHLSNPKKVHAKTRNVKAELRAIPKLRRMVAELAKSSAPTTGTRGRGADPMRLAAALLKDINHVPYFFAGVAREHAKGFAHPGLVLSKYELDLSKLSPRAAADFHVGADNMLGVELGLRFDTVEHALDAVKALERLSMSDPVPEPS